MVKNTIAQLPATREAALACGSKHYFTGRECPDGHLSPRFASSCTCVECGRFAVRKRKYGSVLAALSAASKKAAESDAARVSLSNTACFVEGCDRPARSLKHGLCEMHRQRFEKSGSVGQPNALIAARGAPTLLHCSPPRGQCPAAKKLLGMLDYARNADAVKARTKNWADTHQDELAAKRKAQYAADPDKKKAELKAWKKANPGRNRANNARSLAKYREHLRLATPPWVDWKAIDAIYEACPKGWHVDHIIPVQNPIVCGLHVPGNLQYLPASENCSKNNRFDESLLAA